MYSFKNFRLTKSGYQHSRINHDNQALSGKSWSLSPAKYQVTLGLVMVCALAILVPAQSNEILLEPGYARATIRYPNLARALDGRPINFNHSMPGLGFHYQPTEFRNAGKFAIPYLKIPGSLLPAQDVPCHVAIGYDVRSEPSLEAPQGFTDHDDQWDVEFAFAL
jgi:hypothetical protein